MPQVKMADGSIVNMPDNPSPEMLADIEQINNDFMAQKHKETTFNAAASKVTDIPLIRKNADDYVAATDNTTIPGALKAAGSGLARGGMSLVNLVDKATGYAFLPQQAEHFEPITAPVDAMLPKPVTVGEHYIHSIGEGAGAAIATPGGGGLLKSGLIGGFSGLGSEVGERTIGGTPGRVIGGLGFGLGASVPSMFAGNTQSLARRALTDVTDNDITAALAAKAAAKSQGVGLTLGQSLGRPTNVDALEAVLANNEVGRRTADMFRRQPTQVASLANNTVNKLPGDIIADRAAGQLAKWGATKSLEGDKAALSAEVGRIKPTKGHLTQRDIADIQGQILSKAGEYPNTTTGAALHDLANKFVDPLTGRPYTNITQIDNILKDVASGIKAPGIGKQAVSSHGQGLIEKIISDVRARIGDKFPKFQKANEIFAAGKDNIINPAKAGPVGFVAGKQGFIEGDAAKASAMHQVFAAGTNPNATTSEILTLQHAMSKAGTPEAFITPAKSYLSDTLAKAITVKIHGAGTNTAASVEKALQGDVMQKTGLRDILVGIARAQKQPDNAIYPGFEKVMDTISRASKRPGKVMGMNEHELRGDSSRNLASNALRVFSFMPVEKVAGNMERLYSNKAMKALDYMVTTPEGIKELQRLARLPRGSKELETGVATIMATYANADDAQQPGKLPD